jgi:DNA ligase-4
VAKNQSGLLVVYGGSTTRKTCVICLEVWLTSTKAYDIKLIMNKGLFDILRPQWLFDSIARKELVPMSKKYFFHATAERMESEEYLNKDGQDLGQPPEESASRMSPTRIHADAEASESKEEDSEMQEWLEIGPGPNAAASPDDDADSVTDPESGDEDNWFSIGAQQPGSAAVSEMEVIICHNFGGIGIHLATSDR